MIALLSKWQLKDGCPPDLASALDELTAAVLRDEPGTLMYSVNVPGANPPIGPPPDYAVYNIEIRKPEPQSLVFFEVYRDAEAFSAHLRGAVKEFMNKYRDYFVTPWQGHPRPEVTYLDPRTLFAREVQPTA